MRMLKSPSVLLLLCAVPAKVSACAVCFGAKGDPVVESMGWAILFLLMVVVCMVGGIVAFFVTVARRTREYEQKIQEGGAEWGDSPEALKNEG